MSDEPTGAVYKDGVLYDDQAVAVIKAVAKSNCKNTLDLNNSRVQHFVGRMNERIDASPEDTVIVIINADDVHGGPLLELLMPGHDWQQYRDRGEVPFGRGLASRDGIQEAIDLIDKDTGAKLRSIKDAIAVVVVDHGTAEAFKVLS